MSSTNTVLAGNHTKRYGPFSCDWQILLALQLELNANLHHYLVFSPKAYIQNKFRL